jgi:hypothetical protein
VLNPRAEAKLTSGFQNHHGTLGYDRSVRRIGDLIAEGQVDQVFIPCHAALDNVAAADKASLDMHFRQGDVLQDPTAPRGSLAQHGDVYAANHPGELVKIV